MTDSNLIQIIYEALGETYQKYGLSQVSGAVRKGIISAEFDSFTNNKGSRINLMNYMKAVGETLAPQNAGFNYTFFEGIIDCYIKSITKEQNPQTDFERNILATAERFSTHPRGSEIVRNHLMSKAQIDMNSILLGREYDPRGYINQMLARVCECYQKEQAPKLQARNVQLHGANMQRAREGIISGLTRAKEGEIHLENMHACTSIGKRRHNQEDAVLIKTHPQNPNFKLLIVSDGMGGAQSGEIVSNYTVSEFAKWFDNVDAAYYKAPDELAKKFDGELKRISADVYGKYFGNAGATFVGAIVCEDETIVTNVGDSRAYTYHKATNQLIQQSEDHSHVERLYQAGLITKRDDMRFHMQSNVITQHIGMQEDYDRVLIPNTWLVPNQDYDQLILVSDGVSDCLSDQDILVITQRTPREQLAQMLVSRALENTSVARPQLSRNAYYDRVNGGKDNTSAVVLDNER